MHHQLRQHGHHGQHAAGRRRITRHGTLRQGLLTPPQVHHIALKPLPASIVHQAHSLDEVEDFVGIAAALLINMGTLSSEWIASKKLAAQRVRAGGR